jgi:sulfofructose kinase
MKARVLTVGVAVVDFVMNVDDIPTAAAKYRANDAQIVGGGCGASAAVAINRLGGDALLIARLGNDEIADMIIDQLTQEGVDCQRVRRFKGRRSSFSSVFVDRDGERLIMNYRDHAMPGDADWMDPQDLEFAAALADTRWPAGAESAMRLARDRGKPGVMDAEAPLAGLDDALAAASHVFFSAQGLREYAATEDLSAGLAIVEQRLGDVVGVTDGVQGVRWRCKGHEHHQPAFRVDVVDTLGAGDVWHGACALALGEKMPLEQAIQFSNAVAALKCTRLGGRAGSPMRQDVENFMKDALQCN